MLLCLYNVYYTCNSNLQQQYNSNVPEAGNEGAMLGGAVFTFLTLTAGFALSRFTAWFNCSTLSVPSSLMLPHPV